MSDRPIIKNQSSGYCSGDGNPACAGRWAGATVLHHKTFDLASCDELNEEAFRWLVDELLGEEKIEIEAYFDCGYDETVGIGQYADLDEWFLDDSYEELIDKCPYLDEAGKKAVFDAIERFAEDENGYEPYEID